MGFWNTYIIQPLSYLLKFFYEISGGSYGMAIILFTILTKVILLPLSMKQQKSMVEMQRIQPLLQKIQAKYKNDQEKLGTETMKLYKEHNISPFSGCLPLLIQLPIIYALYDVIRKAGEITGVTDYMFLKIFDLSLTPHLPDFSNLAGFWTDPNTPILLIPILSVVSTYLQSALQPGAAKQKDGENPAAQSMGMMKYIMPLFSGYIAFIVPAGVGLYWIVSGLLQILQQVIITKYYTRKLDRKGDVIEEHGKTDRSNRKKH